MSLRIKILGIEERKYKCNTVEVEFYNSVIYKLEVSI